MFMASGYAVRESHEVVVKFMVVDGTGSVKLPQFASVGQADILFVRCDTKWLVVGVWDGLWIHRLEGFRCYSEKQPQDVGVRVYYGASECYVEGQGPRCHQKACGSKTPRCHSDVQWIDPHSTRVNATKE
ncbi:hypothetical protein Pelo_19653 [Pelomyxa schiedti]|nr:hypothetical protein Pelo_19653 [Pelomyxa schiedti]